MNWRVERRRKLQTPPPSLDFPICICSNRLGNLLVSGNFLIISGNSHHTYSIVIYSSNDQLVSRNCGMFPETCKRFRETSHAFVVSSEVSANMYPDLMLDS